MKGASKKTRALAAATIVAALVASGLVAMLGSDDVRDVSGGPRRVRRATSTSAARAVRSTVEGARDDTVRTPHDERASTTQARPARSSSNEDQPGPGRRGWTLSAGFPRWAWSTTVPAITKPAGEDRRVGTDSHSLPGCSHEVCTEGSTIEGRAVEMPGSDERDVETSAVDVPGRCASFVCIGSFTFRPISAVVPGSDPRWLSVPGASVPAICRSAERACMGPTEVPGQTMLVVPGSPERRITDPVTVTVTVDGEGVGLQPGAGEFDTVGPFYFPVDVPEVGVIDVMLCPQGCAWPRTTEGRLDGHLTVDVAYGDEPREATVPIEVSW
jgi:hypothetical protein